MRETMRTLTRQEASTMVLTSLLLLKAYRSFNTLS